MQLQRLMLQATVADCGGNAETPKKREYTHTHTPLNGALLTTMERDGIARSIRAFFPPMGLSFPLTAALPAIRGGGGGLLLLLCCSFRFIGLLYCAVDYGKDAVHSCFVMYFIYNK